VTDSRHARSWLIVMLPPDGPSLPSAPAAPAPTQAANLALPELLVDWQQETVLMTPVAAVFSLSAFKVCLCQIARGHLLPARLPAQTAAAHRHVQHAPSVLAVASLLCR
jgi:hypothetical protein